MLDSGFKLFQVFSQLRLAPGQVPGVQNENHPNKTIGQEEEFISHAIHLEDAAGGRDEGHSILAGPRPTITAGEEEKRTGRETRPN